MFRELRPYKNNAFGRSEWSPRCMGVLSHPLLAHPPFSIPFQNIQKCIGFINVLDTLTGPCWSTQGNVKNPTTSATLHENASRKYKTSAALHGNMFLGGMVQIGLPKRVPQKRPKPFVLNCFGCLLEPHWSTRVAHTKKWGSPSGRQRAPIASAQSIDFSDAF